MFGASRYVHFLIAPVRSLIQLYHISANAGYVFEKERRLTGWKRNLNKKRYDVTRRNDAHDNFGKSFLPWCHTNF